MKQKIKGKPGTKFEAFIKEHNLNEGTEDWSIKYLDGRTKYFEILAPGKLCGRTFAVSDLEVIATKD